MVLSFGPSDSRLWRPISASTYKASVLSLALIWWPVRRAALAPVAPRKLPAVGSEDLRRGGVRGDEAGARQASSGRRVGRQAAMMAMLISRTDQSTASVFSHEESGGVDAYRGSRGER